MGNTWLVPESVERINLSGLKRLLLYRNQYVETIKLVAYVRG